MDSPGGVKGLKAGGLDAEIISTLATG
jgi:hypothetical protein